jgi:hypothetical protein
MTKKIKDMTVQELKNAKKTYSLAVYMFMVLGLVSCPCLVIVSLLTVPLAQIVAVLALSLATFACCMIVAVVFLMLFMDVGIHLEMKGEKE